MKCLYNVESISDMFTRFSNIVNTLKPLSRDTLTFELVSKVLYLLAKKLEPKVTVIFQAKDHNKLELNQVIGSLSNHEMINSNEDDKKKKKKKDLVLKAYPDGDDEDFNDEDSLPL